MKALFSAVATLLLAIVVFGLDAPLAQARQHQVAKKTVATVTQNKTAGASGCALLPVTALEKTLGAVFQDQPSEAKAPPAYDGAWGWSCEFFSKPPFPKGHQTSVDLLIYTEASAAEAKQTFDKAAPFFMDSSKAKPSGIGDSAYWQTGDQDELTIHVLKDKSHYSISMQPTDEKQLLQLASALAARL